MRMSEKIKERKQSENATANRIQDFFGNYCALKAAGKSGGRGGILLKERGEGSWQWRKLLARN